jgi:lysozyme
MLYGVDVHDGYQAGLNFSLLRQQGYTFAAVKLTQGTGYQRDLGDDWVRAARSAGLVPGGYHWLTAADGAAQARWFHHKVVESGGPAGMMIQLDCEDDAGPTQIKAWAAEWLRLSGGHPFLIYSGSWWWAPHVGSFRGVDVTPYLWHSHYLTADTDTVPDDPAALAALIPAYWWLPGYGGWYTATILQFTSRGDAGTLGNKVDLNVTHMTREQLLALTRPAGTTTGDDVLTDPQNNALAEAWALATALREGVDAPAAGNDSGGPAWAVTALNEIRAAVKAPTVAVALSTEDRAAIVADLLAALTPEIRDAVADLGEGGAAQVRTDA